MYVIYHAIFICVVNAWSINRCQSHQLKERPLKLRTFTASLSESLISTGKAPRGQPASLPSPRMKERKFTPSHPQDDVRKDGVGYLPIVTSNRLRCRNCVLSANTFSTVVCAQCNVTLCLKKERNCFFEYHKPRDCSRQGGSRKAQCIIFDTFNNFLLV